MAPATQNSAVGASLNILKLVEIKGLTLLLCVLKRSKSKYFMNSGNTYCFNVVDDRVDA
ncbi:MAG: hypothetical protein ACI9KF_000305 [Arenicella sp.]|jgi:hypothetical protein